VTSAVDRARQPRPRRGTHLLTVRDVERLTEDSVMLTFDVPAELSDTFRFSPGQHVALMSPNVLDNVRRSYSICAPATSQDLRVAVKRITGGAFSRYVHTALQPGDVLEVMTPTGSFCPQLDPDHSKLYVAAAAGSGITPIISIISTTLEVEPRSTFILLYGNKTTASTMFLDEIHDLKARYPERFAVYFVMSREAQAATTLSGRISAKTLGSLVPVDSPAVDDWFLCGPVGMVENLKADLLGRGVDERHIHREIFHLTPTERAAAPPETRRREGVVHIRFRLDGREATAMDEPGDRSLLDAVLRVRPDAPYACRDGVCGTCRALLTGGEIAMRNNYALERDDLDRGFVLTCQASPRSASISLDFDE
jgi:ring-1,2-phenylacetyl-CoA epoxidase subunit PaaE